MQEAMPLISSLPFPRSISGCGHTIGVVVPDKKKPAKHVQRDKVSLDL